MRNYLTGLRKFALALLCLIGGFWLAWFDKDVGGYTVLASAVLAFYSGANVMQNWTTQRYGKGKRDDDNNQN